MTKHDTSPHQRLQAVETRVNLCGPHVVRVKENHQQHLTFLDVVRGHWVQILASYRGHARRGHLDTS